MKKIIVFGATGHVGSYFTKYAEEYFDSEEYQIIPSGRRKTDFFNKKGFEYYSVDISNPLDFDSLPQDDVYAIVLLAAEIPAYMNGYHPEKYIKTIINGTYNVMEYARKVKADRVLFSTSCYDVFEYPAGTIIKPDMPLNFKYTGDHALYVICKNTVIEILEHYYQEYGIKKFIFRLPTVYSYSPNHFIYPKGKKTLRPLYKLIENAKKGEPLEIWGDPNYAKDMLYVYDLGQMFCKAIEKDLEYGFYNCGTGIPVTLMQQMQAIIKVFSPKEKQSEILILEDKIAGGGLLMDVQNAKEELGYSPVYTVEKLFLEFQKEMEINQFADLRD